MIQKGFPQERIIIPHIMHMAHISFFMGISFLPPPGIRIIAKSIHQKRAFVNPFLQFFKKKNSFL